MNAVLHQSQFLLFLNLTCHSVEDFHILNSRDQQKYTISQEDIDIYEHERYSLLAVAAQCGNGFSIMSHNDMEIGLMKPDFLQNLWNNGLPVTLHSMITIYQKGMLDYKKEIQEHIQSLDFLNDTGSNQKNWKNCRPWIFRAMRLIVFAERHAELAEEIS